jgi:hypothetical protein
MSNNNQSTRTSFPELAAQCSEKKHDTTEELTRLDLGGRKESCYLFADSSMAKFGRTQ